MHQRTCPCALSLAAAAALVACGGGSSSNSDEAPLTVAKVASCASGGKPETGLQGQVPAALRAAGFTGFSCNLSLVSQLQGEGGNWSAATFIDTAGRRCHYHSTGTPNATRTTPGVPVIDITDAAQPQRVTSLTTQAMLDPWESLRVSTRRQILIADNGSNAVMGGPEFDIYDIAADCRSPQLLASVQVGTGTDGGMALPGLRGHEGNFAPDGLTYYIGDTVGRRYHAVDIVNTSKPKVIASFDMNAIGLRSHGLSVSGDGNRMYAVTPGSPANAAAIADPNVPATNGFVVLDTSEVQARKPDAQIKLISRTLYKDGSTAQHTIPIRIGGKPYLVMVDEAGSGGLADAQNNYIKNACAAGLPPFPMARIYDLKDETQPALVSKLMLETHDCKNSEQVQADVIGLSTFTYGSHYCSVDNRDNATALACSYFNSGIRVFDIRNPARPKEIAYYNPASASAVPGSNHAAFGQWRAGGPDWCASRLDFDFARRQLVTMCQDNGMLVMQFATNTWPFNESTPSFDHN